MDPSPATKLTVIKGDGVDTRSPQPSSTRTAKAGHFSFTYTVVTGATPKAKWWATPARQRHADRPLLSVEQLSAQVAVVKTRQPSLFAEHVSRVRPSTLHVIPMPLHASTQAHRMDISQNPVLQSDPSSQVSPTEQRLGQPPLQSTSVSRPFWMPSSQVTHVPQSSGQVTQVSGLPQYRSPHSAVDKAEP